MGGEVEVLVDGSAQVGEGPVWDQVQERLVWVDIVGREVHEFDPASGDDVVYDVGRDVGAAVPTDDGRLLLAVPNGLALLDRDSASVTLLVDVDSDPARRFNDGKTDPAGRFWVGTMRYDLAPGDSTLYRMDTPEAVTPVLEGIGLSNGLGWSPDGSTMFFVDSLTYGVDAFDFAAGAGALTNRRRFTQFSSAAGMPDGMCVDAEGGVWVAMFGAGVVQHLSPTAELLETVRIPGAAQITSCAFGGPDLRDLYVTSAAHGLTAAARAGQPRAGALFRLRPGVSGLPTTPAVVSA